MMKITRWNPFLDIDGFFGDDMARAMPTPAIELAQDDNNVIVSVSTPGVNPKDITVNIHDNILSIEGETEKENKEDKKDYYRQEIFRGSFSRSITLPTEVQSEKAEAESSNGILTITIPKAERVQPKTIDVKVKDKE